MINICSCLETPESSKKTNKNSKPVRRSLDWRYANLEPFTKIDGTPDLRYKQNTKVCSSNWDKGKEKIKSINNTFTNTDYKESK